MGRLIADMVRDAILPLEDTGEEIAIDLAIPTMRVNNMTYGNPTVFKRFGFVNCSPSEFRYYFNGGKPLIVSPDPHTRSRMLLCFEHTFDGVYCLGLNLIPPVVDGPGAPAGMA